MHEDRYMHMYISQRMTESNHVPTTECVSNITGEDE